MRRTLFATLGALAVSLALASAASAHSIDYGSLTCQGSAVHGVDFPSGRVQFGLQWWDGTAQTVNATADSNGNVTAGPVALPEIPPNGTHAWVVWTWTADGGGSFDVSQTLSCQPAVTNTSIDCAGFHFTWTSSIPSPVIVVAWPATGWASTSIQESGRSGTTTVPLPQTPSNGTVVTSVASWPGGSTPLVSSQPTNCAPPPVPPVTATPAPVPPTALAPLTPPAAPAPPATPAHHPAHHPAHRRCVRAVRVVALNNQDPAAASAARSCTALPASKVHVTVGPQGLSRGIATLRVSAPRAVKRISVTIHGHDGQVTFTHLFPGHALTFRMDVASRRLFGTWAACGCTYGPADRIVVVLTGWLPGVPGKAGR